MFLINKTNQGNSLGKEVINTLCTEIKSAGWKSIGLGVHLKNWKGLRFWKNNGFNRILEIYGDKEYDESTYSIIALKKEL
jgi:ribosomal protein S18 acetylase RimI-like enzyme